MLYWLIHQNKKVMKDLVKPLKKNFFPENIFFIKTSGKYALLDVSTNKKTASKKTSKLKSYELFKHKKICSVVGGLSLVD